MAPRRGVNVGLDRPDVVTEPSLAPNLARIAKRLDGVLGTILSVRIELSPAPSSDLGR